MPFEWAMSGRKNSGAKNPSILRKPLKPTKRNVGFIKSFKLIKPFISFHILFFSACLLPKMLK